MSDFYAGFKKKTYLIVLSLLLYLLLPVGWSSCCQNMGQQGSLCSLSAWRLVLQQLQPSSRHPFAKIALPSLLFFLPIAFFIRLNSNHPLRLSSGPFLRIILPNPPGWVMYGLIPAYFTCLCQLPPKDGVTCVSPAQDTLTHWEMGWDSVICIHQHLAHRRNSIFA